MTVQSPNFSFLDGHEPLLLRYAAAAERYVFTDPNTALIKVRQFAEVLASEVAAATGVWSSDGAGFLDILNSLSSRGALSADVERLFHGLRKAGNAAAHHHAGDRRNALQQLQRARTLAGWFHVAFGSKPGFKLGAFVPPPNPEAAEAELSEELERLRQELADERARSQEARSKAKQAHQSAEEAAKARAAIEAEAQRAFDDLQAALELAEETEEQLASEQVRFRQQLAETQARTAPSAAEQAAALQRVREADRAIRLTEADTRQLIDERLRESGWEVDSQAIRWSKGARPVKGRNRAIAEVPTKTGPADYVLFAGLTAIGVVEAKRRNKRSAAAIEQARRYSEGFLDLDDVQLAPGGPWGKHRVPFLFSTNGRPFLRQLLEESGTWFLDARVSTNHPRALEGWYSPEGLEDLLTVDEAGAERSLLHEPTDYLDLRDYQLDAIRAAESAVAEGRREMLLAMATGTGKTRTSIGLLYRLVKADRFRRVLFLVDRTSLGEQAFDAYKNVRLENLQSFTDIYDVKELGDLRPDRDTRLHFATVQGMVRRLLLDEDTADPIPVDAYDCIVIDECHRGYNLDRELSDTEFTFRSEDEYISKYRRVLDHFDAVKIGLTATPAKHTTDIFGEPVFTYSYRRAVVDGYLVDHEPPIRILTDLSVHGITWAKGDEIKKLVLRTGEVERHTTPDEVKVEVEKFNKVVVTENFNRVVCAELAKRIDPELPGKTLVFAATDRHADMLVRLLKEAFTDAYGAIADKAVVKITGAADKPSQRIREFKNEPDPRIVVTVDLLTTGIDVPAITSLVFLRRVRSRILYEQMIGRATRLCRDLYGDGEDKEVFRIFDAVDLYAALLPHTDMKPVVTNPTTTFAQLVQELTEADEPAVAKLVLEQLQAKLRRRIRRLTPTARQAFETLAQQSPDDFARDLRQMSPTEARKWFREHPRMAELLDDSRAGYSARLMLSDHVDTLHDVEVGYGDAEKPEDYLEGFGRWLEEHINDLPALLAVTQRPRDLTRQQLRELMLELDQAGYREAHLRAAWRQSTNQDIAATILGHIRQQALGSPLEAYDRRVDRGLDRILASRAWTSPQRRWLKRIAKQLKKNTLVDRSAFDSGAFQAEAGGYDRLNRVFDGQLDEVVGQLTDAVWEDVG